MDFRNVDVIHDHIEKEIQEQTQQLEQDNFSPIDLDTISQAETRTGFRFPKSYKIFLQKLGMPEFSDGTKFVNIDKIEVCHDCGDMAGMVVFAKNVSDNIFLFGNQKGDEYDIFLGDPENGRCIKIADDFESWLNKQIELITDSESYHDHDFILANNTLEGMEKCKSCNLEGLKKYVTDI